MPVKDRDGDLDMLLEKIFNERGWDFRNYKRSSVMRRISKRLALLDCPSYGDYSVLLDRDPSEYDRLFSNLTIKVSEFFREPEVFARLCEAVKEDWREKALKVWCCGCGHGEEAYSIAILLSECLSFEAISNARIFATDIDHDALDAARKALYREESMKNVLQDLRDKYFSCADGLYKVKHNIRNLVKFGVLDIVRNPSISGVDVLFCRNLFIYFNKSLQAEVFEKLDYSLKPGGLLVLGKAEVIPPLFAHKYAPVGTRLSTYRKRT
ncbi:MAG: hypothetical protein A2X99_03960 [Deltaproteobacteria bacterium GWB2_55_19]|nr:MAG: hypothetical protein A2X99_03960 [Deltaproteobacteria bacterium GWB2_55_19]HAO92552.1 hypothetical protein [Deltaproteobacteria bacterium]